MVDTAKGDIKSSREAKVFLQGFCLCFIYRNKEGKWFMIPVGRNGKQFHDTEKDRHTHTDLELQVDPGRLKAREAYYRKQTVLKGHSSIQGTTLANISSTWWVDVPAPSKTPFPGLFVS